ncbi:MAG: hypothetical protein ACI9NQ_001169 [Paracoccaceae bacterium]
MPALGAGRGIGLLEGKRKGQTEMDDARSNEEGDAVGFQGIGGWPFEVIEDELIPLIAGGFGEAFLDFLLAVGADHHGEGIVNHAFAEAHAGDGVVDEFGEGDLAGGALAGPLGVIARFPELLGAVSEVFVVFEEGVDAFAGIFGEAGGHFTAAREAHRVFEDAFGSLEDFRDGERVCYFLKGLFASEALFEWFVVLKRVEKWRNVTHA